MDELVKDLRESAPKALAEADFDFVEGWLKEAADAIEELSRENESLAKSVNEASEILRKRWIPVTERLPDERQFVLAWKDEKPKGFACICLWMDNAGWAFKNITHWMPLPEPPKEET